MPPLLSICIPTYNRSHLLCHLLRCLGREYSGLSEQGEVEIIVSDNCSEDGTPSVVKDFQELIPIRYYRNEQNIGGTANILQTPSLATGVFCWIVGDDDLLVPGALVQVLQLLQQYPNVPAIVVGYSYQKEEDRDLFLDDAKLPKFDNSIYSTTVKPHFIDRWENTFFETKTAALHTSIVGCVFLREDWQARFESFSSLWAVDDHTSLQSTFPHTLIWSSSLISRPVLFCPQPYVYFFLGSQEWFQPKWQTMVFSFCLQLAQFFRIQGADEEAVKYYESLLLRQPGLTNLILEPNSYARAHFSFSWLLKYYGMRDELWENLLNGTLSLHSRSAAVLARVCMRESLRHPPLWPAFIRYIFLLLFLRIKTKALAQVRLLK